MRRPPASNLVYNTNNSGSPQREGFTQDSEPALNRHEVPEFGAEKALGRAGGPKRKRPPQIRLSAVAKKLSRMLRLIDFCPPALGNEDELKRVRTFGHEWLEDVKHCINNYLLVQKARLEARQPLVHKVAEPQVAAEKAPKGNSFFAGAQPELPVCGQVAGTGRKSETFCTSDFTGEELLAMALPDGEKQASNSSSPRPTIPEALTTRYRPFSVAGNADLEQGQEKVISLHSCINEGFDSQVPHTEEVAIICHIK